MRMKCIGAQSVPRPTAITVTKGVLALCRREAQLGEHRTYVKPPGGCPAPVKLEQLILF